MCPDMLLERENGMRFYRLSPGNKVHLQFNWVTTIALVGASTWTKATNWRRKAGTRLTSSLVICQLGGMRLLYYTGRIFLIISY